MAQVTIECISYLQSERDGDFDSLVGKIVIDTDGESPQLYITSGETTIGIEIEDLFEVMRKAMWEMK